MSTIHELTDWMRAHLIHFSGGTNPVDFYEYYGWPPVDLMMYPLPGQRHITWGCWGTAGFYSAVLRTINIPVLRTDVNLNDEDHSTMIFLSEDLSMSHADDVYTQTTVPSGANVPTSSLFTSLADMETLYFNPTPTVTFSRSNTVGEQAAYNRTRNAYLRAWNYMADHLMYVYAAQGAPALDSMLEGVDSNGQLLYVYAYLNSAERSLVLQDVQTRLTEIGNGDIVAGGQKVIDRVDRWWDNK